MQSFRSFQEINSIQKRGIMGQTLWLDLKLTMKGDEWEVPASQVIIEKRLGEGFFGYVFQEVIGGLISNPKVLPSIRNNICPIVAIKQLKCEIVCTETLLISLNVCSFCQCK